MDITVYLPDELGKWAKENDLPLSRMLRDAVEAEQRRREAVAGLAAAATIYELAAREPYEPAGDGPDIHVRLHGTLIATENVSDGHTSTQVYLGQDGKLYVHDFLGEFHCDVDPGQLQEHVGVATYVEAMCAIGQVPVIEVGLPE
jgi:hypothetical protein